MVISLVYRRYIHKRGKKLGPYYYHNVRDKHGKVKSVYVGRKHPDKKQKILKFLYFFLITIILVAIIAGSFNYLQNKNIRMVAEDTKMPFEVDQILIKVLIKSGEFITKELRIMNTGEKTADIDVWAENLLDIVGIDEPSFTIKLGQTKAIKLYFSSFVKEKNIEQKPGVYIGKLVVLSGNSKKEIPVIVEIESSNVLFDMNLNPLARDRRILRGTDAVIEVRLFNLEGIAPVNVNMDYFVKDLDGNTIITESETVVVKTQASFFKTLNIPKGLRTGNYVFVAEAEYAGSVGTSSYLFEVVSTEPARAEERVGFSLVRLCRADVVCWTLSLILLLVIFSVGAYIYFVAGAYIYNKVSRKFVELLRRRGRKKKPGIKRIKPKEEKEPEKEEEIKAKGRRFFLFRLPSEEKKKEEREIKKLERETKKLERIKERQEKRKEKLLKKKERKETLKEKVQKEKERLKKLEEKKKEELKKELFEYIHKLGLAKTEEEKLKLKFEKEKRKEEKRKEKARIEKERGIVIHRGLKKCYSLLDMAHEYLRNNEIDAAKKAYARCREEYIELDDEEKAEIYKQLHELYEQINR